MVLAIEALETCFCRSMRISSSWPSSLDLPSASLGRPAQSALGRCRGQPFLERAWSRMVGFWLRHSQNRSKRADKQLFSGGVQEKVKRGLFRTVNDYRIQYIA